MNKLFLLAIATLGASLYADTNGVSLDALRESIKNHEFDKTAAQYTAAIDAGITTNEFEQAGIQVVRSNDGDGGICFKLKDYDVQVCEQKK